MIGLHIAGVPVEEILLPALAAAGPAIALAWLELRARIKRLTDRRHSPTARAAAPPSTCWRRRGVGRHALGFGTMSSVDRSRVRELMGEVMTAQGRALPADDTADLRDIGFRSLDFSELALRVEDELGDELNFDAPGLRRITTVGDVLDFIEQLQSA